MTKEELPADNIFATIRTIDADGQEQIWNIDREYYFKGVFDLLNGGLDRCVEGRFLTPTNEWQLLHSLTDPAVHTKYSKNEDSYSFHIVNGKAISSIDFKNQYLDQPPYASISTIDQNGQINNWEVSRDYYHNTENWDEKANQPARFLPPGQTEFQLIHNSLRSAVCINDYDGNRYYYNRGKNVSQAQFEKNKTIRANFRAGKILNGKYAVLCAKDNTGKLYSFGVDKEYFEDATKVKIRYNYSTSRVEGQVAHPDTNELLTLHSTTNSAISVGNYNQYMVDGAAISAKKFKERYTTPIAAPQPSQKPYATFTTINKDGKTITRNVATVEEWAEIRWPIIDGKITFDKTGEAIHSLDGPAIIYNSITSSHYYVDGKCVFEKNFQTEKQRYLDKAEKSKVPYATIYTIDEDGVSHIHIYNTEKDFPGFFIDAKGSKYVKNLKQILHRTDGPATEFNLSNNEKIECYYLEGKIKSKHNCETERKELEMKENNTYAIIRTINKDGEIEERSYRTIEEYNSISWDYATGGKHNKISLKATGEVLHSNDGPAITIFKNSASGIEVTHKFYYVGGYAVGQEKYDEKLEEWKKNNAIPEQDKAGWAPAIMGLAAAALFGALVVPKKNTVNLNKFEQKQQLSVDVERKR